MNRHQSHLFTVRIWPEALQDRVEWRGKVQHVLSGEARYFREWPALVAFLLQALSQPDDPPGPTTRRSETL
jgi:hypothetical protein